MLELPQLQCDESTHDKDTPVRDPLQIWFDRWTAANATSPAYFRDGASAQIVFVRDELAELIWRDVPYAERASEGDPQSNCKVTGYVIGEHRSLGVRLPIYLFARADLGIQFVMRGNGTDWRLSVMSERPTESDLFPYLFHTTPPIEPEYTGNQLAAAYFKGFPTDCIFGYHCEDPRRWSACLDQPSLWTVIFLCMRSAGAIQPKAWRTREAHLRALIETT